MVGGRSRFLAPESFPAGSVLADRSAPVPRPILGGAALTFTGAIIKVLGYTSTEHVLALKYEVPGWQAGIGRYLGNMGGRGQSGGGGCC